jgi:hypothetical protein
MYITYMRTQTLSYTYYCRLSEEEKEVMAPWIAAARELFRTHPLLFTPMALDMGYTFKALQAQEIEGECDPGEANSL